MDSISPAFERMTAQLFKPFRFRHWFHLACIAVLTGEFGGSGYSSGTNLNVPWGAGGNGSDPWRLAGSSDPREFLLANLHLVLWGVAVLVALVVLFYYFESVYRFVLLDSVLNGRTEIGGSGWRRWQQKGSSYFLWQMALNVVQTAVMAAAIGWPLYSAWQAGVFREASKNWGTILAGFLGLIFAAVFIVLLFALVASLARDFVVPLMAVEDLSVTQAWGRFLEMLGAEKGSYVLYVLMKIALSIGSAFFFGFVQAMAILVLLIPFGILGLIIFLIAQGLGLTWTLSTILLAAGLVLMVVAVILFVACFLYSPGLVFFQAYPLYFLAGRVPGIGAILLPPPPEPIPPPVTEPPPAPASAG